jgi:hypothetical protein
MGNQLGANAEPAGEVDMVQVCSHCRGLWRRILVAGESRASINDFLETMVSNIRRLDDEAHNVETKFLGTLTRHGIPAPLRILKSLFLIENGSERVSIWSGGYFVGFLSICS